MSNHTIEITLSEICQAVNLSEQKIVELVEHDIVHPIGPEPASWSFDVAMVSTARRAARLHQDLELEWSAVAVIVELIQQRDQLIAENETLKKRLQRFLRT
ncbi:MAG: chaperone modulatory protein CbpM [Pseudohongiellaceae bacterium]|jgi:chaperone modulatory protein CbpM